MNISLRIFAPLAGIALLLSACTPSAPAPQSVAAEAPAPVQQGAPQSQAPAAPAPAPTTQSVPAPAPGAQAPTATEGMLPEAGVAAIAAALAAQPGTVVGLDDGLDDNGHWEVDILPDGANRPIEVKVLNGQVTGTRTDDDDDDVLSLQGMTLTVEAAIAKAFTMMSGTFDSANIEMLNGVPIWDIDIDAPGVDDDHKVQINAVTGEAVLVVD